MTEENKQSAPNVGADGNMVVLSKRGRALKVGRSDQVEMFAKILDI